MRLRCARGVLPSPPTTILKPSELLTPRVHKNIILNIILYYIILYPGRPRRPSGLARRPPGVEVHGSLGAATPPSGDRTEDRTGQRSGQTTGQRQDRGQERGQRTEDISVLYFESTQTISTKNFFFANMLIYLAPREP